MYRVWNFLRTYSLLLVIGAVVALIWANVAPHSYHGFVDYPLWDHAPIGHAHDGHKTLTLHFLINEILMALFFAMAGKEVWEAVILENGSLRGKKAMTPLIATAGGMIGPASIYLLGAMAVGKFSLLASGWAIPTATDIAFSYLVGRLVFGAAHPAVSFLLLLAIADDAGGLIILAVFYPQGTVQPLWLLLSVAVAVGAWFLFNELPRRMDRGNPARPNSTWVRKTLSFWPYVLAGCISWYAFYQAGIHPALGLLPIIPAMPHADRDFGVFAEVEEHMPDTLNAFEHALRPFVEVILLFFGLANAGVEFSAMGEATWLVLAGLLIGKPAGIFLLGMFGARVLGFGLPDGMRPTDLLVMGFVAAIGFTVALFVAAVAFQPGPIQDAAKMGALLSFFASVLAIAAGIIFKVEKKHT